jgi:hypothetical protein
MENTMKYYTDINGNLYANPSNLEGLVEVESAVRADGTLLPKHKNLSLVQTKEDGSYYTYYNQDGTADVSKIAELEATQAREAFKAQRQEAVDNLEVTYEGTIYQGDEVSQGRMSRAILALPDDTTTTLWIAKDNTPMQLTKVDLSSILRLSGEAQTALWTAQ